MLSLLDLEKRVNKLAKQICCKTNQFVGGNTIFTADGVTTQFDIHHNLGQVPSFFMLDSSTPISSNQLDRNITFPDDNTMRITFNNAPSTGDNAHYYWVVYK